MPVIKKYTKQGVLLHTFTGTANGQMCYINDGYFLQQIGRSLSLYQIDGKVVTSTRPSLITYQGTSFSGVGVAVDHSFGLNETIWDGKDVFTLEVEDLAVDVVYFRHYVWNHPAGVLTLVNSVSLGGNDYAGGLEYNGHRVFLSKRVTAPGNYQVIHYDYSGKALNQVDALNFGTTHPVTDIAFDGAYMWRLRTTVPEVVQDEYEGGIRNAMQLWAPVGTSFGGIMTDGTDIYVASAT